MHDKRAISIREFCRLYGIGRTAAYDEIADGKLRAVKAGRRTLIPIDDAEAWLTSRPPLGRGVVCREDLISPPAKPLATPLCPSPNADPEDSKTGLSLISPVTESSP
jgi:excisionase family DNA binding protein